MVTAFYFLCLFLRTYNNHNHHKPADQNNHRRKELPQRDMQNQADCVPTQCCSHYHSISTAQFGVIRMSWRTCGVAFHQSIEPVSYTHLQRWCAMHSRKCTVTTFAWMLPLYRFPDRMRTAAADWVFPTMHGAPSLRMRRCV